VVQDAIAGRGCHIGRSAVVGPGSVLGDKTSLTDYTITGQAAAQA
jgi:UDP-3-O-[3-hydroxymyristoyl] glucosamine N-acyltransferase